jgi:hypothetical protein
VKIGHLGADVVYLRSDYLFLIGSAKEDAVFVLICGSDSEVERLKTKLASVSGQLYYSWTVFLKLNRRVLVLSYGVLFYSFSCFCVTRVLKFFFRNFCVDNVVLTNC